MKLLRDADIDPAPLAGQRVAILGYGNQGRAQALNLEGQRDRRRGRPSRRIAQHGRAAADGIVTAPIERRGARRASSCCSPPTKRSRPFTATIEPALAAGAALGFSHGLAIRFGQIVPRADLDVIMVAPKGPGTALRSLYREGKGMVGAFSPSRRTPAAAPRRWRWPMAGRSAAAVPG